MSYITKSPWIIHYDGSSCNGCDIEVLACLTPMYDVERFGIINTGNPKHADIFLITGSINEQNISVVKQIYEQMPEPKVVAAIGICATSGGVFRECYNIMGGVDTVIPVDVYVPGCAARPEAIIDGVVQALGVLDEKKKNMSGKYAEAQTGAEGAAAPAGSSDGTPPNPPEDPLLPGDDVEVQYYGATPDVEEGKDGANVEEGDGEDIGAVDEDGDGKDHGEGDDSGEDKDATSDDDQPGSGSPKGGKEKA